MTLEALLSGIFALGAPAWLLVEQVIHTLGHPSLSRPSHSPGRNDVLEAFRRVA